MRTIEVVIKEPGVLHVEDECLTLGTRVIVEILEWPPKADPEHPLWGTPYQFDDPFSPLPEDEWGSLA